MVMTLEADYAVRIVEYLTKHPERRDARRISEETQIPLRFSLKILRELVAEGFVCSFKGAKGGYTLAKPPEEITLRQAAKACGMPCGTFYSKALRIEEKNRPTFGTDS